ncbi:hypothetical protein [Pseudomonas hormoni]
MRTFKKTMLIMALYRTPTAEYNAMYEDRKDQALTNWHKLLKRPDIRMTAQEQYEELL